MAKVHVLIVDDDVKLLQLLRLQLEHEGLYVVDSAQGGEEALQLIEKHKPDIVVLDLSMPGVHGFEVCRKIRKLDGDLSKIWIIVLSALPAKAPISSALEVDSTSPARPSNKEAALRAGADAYMEKPLDLGELTAHIQAALRRMVQPQVSRNTLEFGNLSINITEQNIYLDKKKIHLTKTQYRVLEILALNAGNVVQSEMIMSKVWGSRGETLPDTARLRTCIRELRHILGEDGDRPRYIITKVGIGYQLCDPSQGAEG